MGSCLSGLRTGFCDLMFRFSHSTDLAMPAPTESRGLFTPTLVWTLLGQVVQHRQRLSRFDAITFF